MTSASTIERNLGTKSKDTFIQHGVDKHFICFSSSNFSILILATRPDLQHNIVERNCQEANYFLEHVRRLFEIGISSHDFFSIETKIH